MFDRSVSGLGNQGNFGLSSYLGGVSGRRRSDDDDGARGPGAGAAQGSGGVLFNALLQALTQAAGIQAPAATAAGTGTSGTGSGSTGSADDQTSVGQIGHDLQRFLHDLFRALRQAGEQTP